MSIDDLTRAVRAQAGVAGEDEAREALLATLEALGAQLGAGAAGELAEPLPDQAADALRRGAGPPATPTTGGGPPARGGTGPDLYGAVARRLGVDETAAADRAQGALRAVARTLDQDRLDRVRTQLPADLARLLSREDEGDTSALHTGA